SLVTGTGTANPSPPSAATQGSGSASTPPSGAKPSTWNNVSFGANWLAFLTFTAGIVYLAQFAYANLAKEKQTPLPASGSGSHAQVPHDSKADGSKQTLPVNTVHGNEGKVESSKSHSPPLDAQASHAKRPATSGSKPK